MIDLFKSLFLGAVQGFTEFLPISSSGHLYVFQHILDFDQMGLAMDITLHLGTLFAVIIYFRNYLYNLLKEILRFDKNGVKEFKMIILGIFPPIFIGLFFGDIIENSRSMNMVIINYLFMGLILFLLKNIKISSFENSYKSAIIIGLIQSFALLPGISRSGITIACAMFLGVKKEESIRFSFIMSIPLILGASIYKVGDIASLASESIGLIFLGFMASSIVGFFAIAWMKKAVELNSFWKFSIYCWLMAVILLFSGF